MRSEWLEVSVTVEAEASEAVAEVLSRYAYHGVAIEAGPEGWTAGPVVVRGYLAADGELEAARRAVEEALWHLGQIRPIAAPVFRRVAEADWASAWKEHIHVMHIGRRIVVRPSWRAYAAAPGELVITLDPGQAFGTGVHPTTRMCLVALEDMLRPEADVLDLGTGSGILAIAAALLGARAVLALDNDPVAVRVAEENVAANGVEDVVRVGLGSLEEAEGPHDLIVVNILAKVIVEMLGAGLAKRLRPRGVMIATGILEDQEAAVLGAAASAGLAMRKRWQTDDWVCLALGGG